MKLRIILKEWEKRLYIPYAVEGRNTVVLNAFCLAKV